MSDAALMFAFLATPLLAAVAVFAFGRHPNLRETVSVTFGLVAAAFAWCLVFRIGHGHALSYDGLFLGEGLRFRLKLDVVGGTYAAIAATLWPLTTVYAAGYLRGHHERNQTRFFICFALAIFGAFGIALSGNLITLFLFYEVLTIVTIPLVAHHADAAAARSLKIYVGVLFGSSICLLLTGIVWVHSLAGSTEFVEGGLLPSNDLQAPALLLALFVFGAGKAALMPMHLWLPNAMVAPTPVSALLHAVAVVKAGVFTILKVAIFIFGVDGLAQANTHRWLTIAAAVSILLGSLIAMRQDNLKARLAYSTVSQLAYITLGASLGNPAGWVGGVSHMVTHAVGKITLFFCAGAIMVASHHKRISEMDGLGRKMPITFAAFALASCSIIGLPPFGGTWSKWWLSLGALDAEATWVVIVLLISSLLNVAYLLPVPLRAFRLPLSDHDAHVHERRWMCTAPLALTAVGCVVLFFVAPMISAFIARHIHDGGTLILLGAAR